MHIPPNELYSAFSFIGFVLCAIPFYWHFKARNTGTCLFMIWTGLGCLLQCINSIVWNKNIINKAPVYCDISSRIQVALNVAIPASSLCINRLLYRVASMKSAGTKDPKGRRIVIIDLLIGVGIPVLQIVLRYIVSENSYNIYEDIGPFATITVTLPAFFLVFAWPVAIGVVSFFYCVMAIRAFYKRRRNQMQLISGHHSGQYLRLMAISFTEIIGTVPLATFNMVFNAKLGIRPWKGLASMHSHYSEVNQIAGFIWKSIHEMAFVLEMFRWSLVACAFVFFALFGLSAEAREQYHRLYKGISTSLSVPHGKPHAPSSVPHVKRNGGVTDPNMVQTGRDEENSSVSLTLTDQSSVLSFSVTVETIRNSDSTTVQDSPLDTVSFYTAESFDEPGTTHDECQSVPPPGILTTVRPAPVPPHLPESTMPLHTSPGVETV